MKFPEKPTCHAPMGPMFKFGNEFEWREPKKFERHEGVAYSSVPHVVEICRTCSYCGSVHPEDLLKLVREQGARLGGADWKYGWPHKFYISGPANGKFYNEHILDEGFDDEAREQLLTLLHGMGGVKFTIVERNGERNLHYAAPYHDYQR